MSSFGFPARGALTEADIAAVKNNLMVMADLTAAYYEFLKRATLADDLAAELTVDWHNHIWGVISAEGDEP